VTSTIKVGADADGSDLELPVEEILTGRGAILGKSGSGKSNTASVVIERLLDAGHPCLIVDVEGDLQPNKGPSETRWPSKNS